MRVVSEENKLTPTGLPLPTVGGHSHAEVKKHPTDSDIRSTYSTFPAEQNSDSVRISVTTDPSGGQCAPCGDTKVAGIPIRVGKLVLLANMNRNWY
ncbi:MAG: hypothetical protein CMM01_24625 [Rhodopirellula sp.]|nr:hypothetical protein [Rhodopirellula sp.]